LAVPGDAGDAEDLAGGDGEADILEIGAEALFRANPRSVPIGELP